MSTPRQYELIYIVSPEATEQEVTDLHTQVESIIGRIGGELVKTENWGRRKMAYEIGPHKEGVYVLEVMNGSGELMKELERRLRVSERVLRYLVVRVDEELRAAERARSRRKVSLRQAESAAAAAAAAAEDTDSGDDRAEEAEVQ
jgi:small subunit ribosomal protein S6